MWMGPINRLIALLERMPSEATLKELIKLGPIAEKMPSDERLRQVLEIKDLLKEMPKDATLKRLVAVLEKFQRDGNIMKLLARLEPYIEILPPPEQLGRLLDGLGKGAGLLGALRE